MGTDHEVYKILLERHLNDDRLMSERSSIFIASSSILFAGFAVLTGDSTMPLRLTICVLGLFLSILAIRANFRTSKGLGFWDEKERKMEAESTEEPFAHMRELNAMPNQVYGRAGGGLRNRHIYTWCIPIVFILLWVSAFVWALVQSA